MIRTHGRSRRSPLRDWSPEPLEGRRLLTQILIPENGLAGVSADMGSGPLRAQTVAVAEYNLAFDSTGRYSSMVFLAMGDAGLWTWSDATGSTRINDRSPEAIVTSMAGITYLDFGSAGLWSYEVDQGYRKLSDSDPETMVVIPTPNSPIPAIAPGAGPFWDGPKLVVDFGAGGLWAMGQSDEDWRKINDVSPEAMAPHGYSVILDYGAQGLWTWESFMGGWAKINDASPEAMVGGISGVAYFDYGSSGLWSYNGAGWRQILAGDPEAIGGSQGRLYVDQGRDGLWLIDASGRLEKLSEANPRSMRASYGAVFLDFGDAGLWRYAPELGQWNRLNDRSPEKVVVDGPADGAVLDFGDGGLWRWDATAGWRRIRVGLSY